MKVEDLMIGDWVYIKDYPIIAQPMQVKKEHFVRSLVEFQPIPLTEEILRKNGFKNDVLAQKSIIAERVSIFSVILISEDNRIMLNNFDEYLNSFNEWHVHIDTEDMRTMCTAEITYIHELQHLLKLCGIKKEIVV